MVQQPISNPESDSSPAQPAKIHLPRTSESEVLKKIRHTTSHVMAMEAISESNGDNRPLD